MPDPAKRKLAILGGGMSSLTTAWELTNQPGWQDRWDITVYQTGWRLGGKGASGRNPELHDRIEEHGLHVLFGFYENAFRVMRECYGEMGRHPSQPLATWQDAFKPHDLIVMMEDVGDGKYEPWSIEAPTNSLTPGDGNEFPEPWQYVASILDFLIERFADWTRDSSRGAVVHTAQRLGLGDELSTLHAQVRSIIDSNDEAKATVTLLGQLESALWNAIKGAASSVIAEKVFGESLFLEMARGLVRAMPSDPRDHDPADWHGITWLLRKFADWIWDLPFNDTSSRRIKYMADLGCTIVIGLIRDKLILPPQDWLKIDDRDFVEWLKQHGAHEKTLTCPIVVALYDAVFSTGLPAAAGTAVHLFLRLSLTYRGSVLYKMQAGMGDVVFAPLFVALQRRGVKFEFFHTVKNLRLSADKKSVEKIEIGRQATVKSGSYQPLYNVKGLPSWPSHPLYDQLVEGGELKAREIDLENFWNDWAFVEEKTLSAGTDFDKVVLGISVGALPFIAKDLLDHNPRFKEMCEKVQTCETQALQLWFTPPLEQFGWPTKSPIVIPYVEPLDTWCDMSQLLVRETWPESVPVGNCSYLCSILPDEEPLPPASDHDYPRRQLERVWKNAVLWTEKYAGGIWPKATLPGTPQTLNYYWLADAKNGLGLDRLKAQYHRAVTSPSERYVIVVPGSSKARLRANESGYSNVFLTGDWTLMSVPAGCLEGATIAGVDTAKAISGTNRAAVGDWLPAGPA